MKENHLRKVWKSEERKVKNIGKFLSSAKLFQNRVFHSRILHTTQHVMHLKLVLIFQSKYFHSFVKHDHGGGDKVGFILPHFDQENGSISHSM